MSAKLARLKIPGLVVTGTDTGVGKTLVAAAIALALRHRGLRVAVLKPAATGCVRQREGLVSEDAEFLAHCADASHPLDLICPQRFAEPLAPAVAAERAGQKFDWEAIERSIRLMTPQSDVMVIEGVGGLLTPMDREHTFADLVKWLGVPAVVVARAGLGTINHTLLTLEALRARRIEIAGVVINRYPPERASAAEETNPRAIEKWGKTSVLTIVPEAQVKRRGEAIVPPLPGDVLEAMARVDWRSLMTVNDASPRGRG